MNDATLAAGAAIWPPAADPGSGGAGVLLVMMGVVRSLRGPEVPVIVVKRGPSGWA